MYKKGNVIENSIKDVDTKSGTIVAYFSKFGNIDSDLDMAVPGMFKKTIAERGAEGKDRIVHLYQHSTYDIISRPQKIYEDAEGGIFESKLNKKRPLSNDVLEMYEDGTLKEHSFGYQVIKDNAVKDDKGEFLYNELIEVRLWEVSSVTWGANEEARFQGFKSEKKEERIKELQDKFDRFSKALRNGKYTDETFYLIEIEVAQLQEMLKSLETDEPIAEITPTIEPMNFDVLRDSFKKNFNR